VKGIPNEGEYVMTAAKSEATKIDMDMRGTLDWSHFHLTLGE